MRVEQFQAPGHGLGQSDLRIFKFQDEAAGLGNRLGIGPVGHVEAGFKLLVVGAERPGHSHAGGRNAQQKRNGARDVFEQGGVSGHGDSTWQSGAAARRRGNRANAGGTCASSAQAPQLEKRGEGSAAVGRAAHSPRAEGSGSLATAGDEAHAAQAGQQHGVGRGFRHGAHGLDADVVDGQTVVIAGVVVFDPTHPQGGTGSPSGGDFTAAASHQACAVAVDGSSCGANDRRAEVEAAARSGPARGGGEGGAEGVFHHHGLSGGVAAIAPLLAVEGDLEAGQIGAGVVVQGHGDPASHGAGGR